MKLTAGVTRVVFRNVSRAVASRHFGCSTVTQPLARMGIRSMAGLCMKEATRKEKGVKITDTFFEVKVQFPAVR